MSREEFPSFPDVPGEDCHARTLRAIEDWHNLFGFWPSVRDLCWWTGDTNASSTMHERVKVLARTKKVEPIHNPRLAFNAKPIGYRVRGHR